MSIYRSPLADSIFLPPVT